MFDWMHKRLQASFSGRHIVDTDEVRVRVTSLWPHGHCGVADVPAEAAAADGEEQVAVACDIGVQLEWSATVHLPGSGASLGSVSGKVKVSDIRLNPDGRVTCDPELLLMGEKSKAEKARDEEAAAERDADQVTAAAAAMSMNDQPGLDAVDGDTGKEGDPEIVPLERAVGTSLEERAREAMANAGVRHVCEVIAAAVAAMVAHASGGEVPPVKFAEGKTSGAAEAATPTSAAAVKDADLPASTLAALRPKVLDKVLGELSNEPPPAVVSMAYAQVRETHFVGEVIPAIAACSSAEGPKVLDLSSCDLTDAGVQQLVATLATGAMPGLTELRLKGNERLTSVSDMMLKGLGMMRKGVSVVRE